MRERIWYEMVDSKYKIIYLGLFISKQRNRNKYYNIIILIFSTSGVLGWNYMKDLPFISSIIVMIMSIIKLIGTELIPNDNTFKKIEKAIDLYCDHFNKIENLWYELNGESINEDKAQKSFYKIMSQEKEISKIVNEVIKGDNKKLQAEAETRSTNYFTNIFNQNNYE